ncbi:MAG: hypothetical protein ACLRRN_08285 [Oscillospiraceae bacterium]
MKAILLAGGQGCGCAASPEICRNPWCRSSACRVLDRLLDLLRAQRLHGRA